MHGEVFCRCSVATKRTSLVAAVDSAQEPTKAPVVDIVGVLQAATRRMSAQYRSPDATEFIEVEGRGTCDMTRLQILGGRTHRVSKLVGRHGAEL